ncbi:hypothetical protein ABFS82_03G088400 [Erythranthe guttata]|nr:PREDICTED: uncharacterized protein LOC105950682 [Erythranthe guttata]|eukprot:XP_012829504.1 PREDICTED: uncharacterized protein LOC105950682 [Erythranthe guttata]
MLTVFAFHTPNVSKEDELRLVFCVVDPNQIKQCTTPEEVWRASNPDSYFEVCIPYEVDPITRNAIKERLKNHPRVYVRDGLPGEYQPRERRAANENIFVAAASYVRSFAGFLGVNI